VATPTSPANDDWLGTPLQFVRGVGPKRAADFSAVGLQTVEDLLLRLPFRYEDRARLCPIAALRAGDTATVSAQVLSCGLRRTRRRGFTIFELAVTDASGQLRVTFLNQPYLTEVFAPRQNVVLHGTVEQRRSGGLQLTNPQYEVVTTDDELVHTQRIVPVYEKVGVVTPKMLRRIVHTALQQLPDTLTDPLPPMVRDRFGFPGRRTALCESHFPLNETSFEDLGRFRAPAQVRLIFEEFFFFQLGLALRRQTADAVHKPRTVTVDDRIRRAALDVLPFRLTDDQKQALREIVSDLRGVRPMNRLLQGDVGSGKTIVALLAALVAMENGLQVAVMSPTELLAEQHYLNLSRLLRPSRFEAVLVTGTMGAAARRGAWERLSSGTVQLAVGTHALVQDSVSFRSLGLVIIDEQHRFGVVQRATLRDKGLLPDVLVMTATPIPRTLALTAYGDLDVSVIRELPPGRTPVTTTRRSDAGRAAAYDLVRDHVTQGRQAYIVYPLVEESEKLDLKAATEMAGHLRDNVFPDRTVALVHGRMRPAERDEVMTAFMAGAVDILVATTVVEVGVDVPNATVMVIEHAERFGLAQLHQLRGRVGRGAHRSACVLLHAMPLSDSARARLDAMIETTDGFALAERDLELRGPGDFFGTRQSGMPTLRIGDLVRDHRVMQEARTAAHDWLERGDASPAELMAVRTGWAARFGLVGVG
jgi:ATP-dependent DNA helicase RecG